MTATPKRFLPRITHICHCDDHLMFRRNADIPTGCRCTLGVVQSTGTIAVLVVGGTLLALIVLVSLPKLFGREARTRRRLSGTQPRAVRDISSTARCRVAGMVCAVGEPLISPLSGRPCVYYETRVSRLVGMDPSALSHKYEIAAEKRSVPFLLDDGTGRAFVDLKHAETLLENDVDYWAGDRESDVDAEDAFLARFKQRRRGLLFKKRLHFVESIIEVGERVAIVANTSMESDIDPPDGPYRTARKTSQLQLVGDSRAPIVITDDASFTAPHDEG